MAPAWVAQDLGLFTKHGLQHSLNYLAATTAIQAIVGGTEEIGLVGNQGIDVALEGADTVYIANTAARFIFHLLRRSGDQVGGRSQRQSFGSHAGGGFYGLRRPHGVAQIWLGAGQGRQNFICRQRPALLTTLKSGNAAAGLMSAPITFQAQELGLKHILNVTELNIPFVFVSVVTTRKILQQKPDAVMRYLRGYTEAISIIRRDKETTMKVMSKFMKTDNRQVLEAIYDEHLPVFQRLPLMTKEPVQAVLDVAKSPKAQQMKPEEFYDNSFLQKLEDSGFINSLYAR